MTSVGEVTVTGKESQIWLKPLHNVILFIVLPSQFWAKKEYLLPTICMIKLFFCHFSILFLLIGCFSLKRLSPGSVVICSQEDVSVEPWKVIQGHLCREPVWTHCWNGGLCRYKTIHGTSIHVHVRLRAAYPQMIISVMFNAILKYKAWTLSLYAFRLFLGVNFHIFFIIGKCECHLTMVLAKGCFKNLYLFYPFYHFFIWSTKSSFLCLC